MNLAQLLADSAGVAPNSAALACGTKITATYAELATRTACIAGGLQDLGLEAGGRVAIAMDNSTAYAEIMIGAWHGGFAVVPMNARLHGREFNWILENSGATVCFADEGTAEAIAAESPALAHLIIAGSAEYQALFDAAPSPLAELMPDDLAWLFYTSGTTGRPKGAMLSHRNLSAMKDAYFSSVDDVVATDCIIHAAPMSHGSGLYLVPHLAAGACQVVPESGGFNPSEVLDLLAHWQGATLFMAPTMVGRFVSTLEPSCSNLSGLKSIIYGGAPMYLEDCLKAIEGLGPKLIQIYGQGEAPMTITALSRAAHVDTGHPNYRARLASVGTAQNGVAVCLANVDRGDMAAGETGEVLVKGDVVMGGYWRNKQATADALRDGWLWTGDLGAFDADGYLTLKDRSKDVIISGGSNIYPREVEEVLLTDPRVLECAVLGAPDPEWGESVAAFVVATDNVTEAQLNQLCRDQIARFKRPKIYRFMDHLPKNNYGKVLKRKLRETLAV